MDLDAVIQEKLDADTDFQNSLVDLSDEDKATAISEKSREVLKSEFESLSKTAKENEQKFKDQQIRASKAEEAAKKAGASGRTVAEVKEEGLSTKDTIAIMNAKVHEDDIDEVVEYARFKKIPVSEALKASVIKASLAEKTENRKTAEVANMGAARRSATKPSDEEILSKARGGEFPEDDADIARLVAAKSKAPRS